jgi:hypothetical protein
MAAEKSTEVEIILAQGEADAKRLEARAKLSSEAQVIYALNDVVCENVKSLAKVGLLNIIFTVCVLALVLSLIIDMF